MLTRGGFDAARSRMVPLRSTGDGTLWAVPTPSERRALLFVAAVAALGLGVRGLRAFRPPQMPGTAREALVSQMAAVDSAVTRGGRSRSKAPGSGSSVGSSSSPAAARSVGSAAAARGPVDLDRATEGELDALPGIGPALARRIIEDRTNSGPFGSLDALQDVRGIGPALATKLAPFVTFSAAPRPPRAAAARSPRVHP